MDDSVLVQMTEALEVERECRGGRGGRRKEIEGGRSGERQR